MRIGIILNPYGEEKPGGLARTIFEWTRALIRNDNQNDYIIFLKNKPKLPVSLPGKNWKMEALKSGWLWLEGLRNTAPADIYIFQTPILPIFYRPSKSIVIVQDFPYKHLKPKNIKEYIRNTILHFYHGFSLRKADMLVAVSQSTKNDIIKFFNIPENKIKVIYMGFNKICDNPQIKIDLPEKFFLFAGVIKERKNVFNIVRAFNEFRKNNPNNKHKLVICGKAEGEYFEDIKNYLNKNRLEKEVLFFGYFNDGQLSYAYRKAEALIFPSIIEGFGMPVLEAMDCGLPVITSNIFGPAETGANGAAILVNPYDAVEIKEAMEKIVGDKDFRAKLIQRGLEQSRQFSWDKAAEELVKVIKILCKN